MRVGLYGVARALFYRIYIFQVTQLHNDIRRVAK